jgi:urate oxidase/2-oxo-4-hydroxy-4-carboxy-5-ureidoimidazoline decarboxylase
MEQFASGWKQHYYGKGDVIVYRLHRDGRTPGRQSPVFGASVLMLTYGDAFWPTYTTGDNSGLVATDSMKNFIQRQTMEFGGDDLAEYCRFLGSTFIDKYPQAEGVQVSAVQIPYAGIDSSGDSVAYAPAGPERAMARVELQRGAVVEATAGVRGFKLLRLGGSAFKGFVRDEYTTLPEITNRPLHMWLDIEWRHTDPADAFGSGATAETRAIVRDVFRGFESGSIQQLIYQVGTKMLAAMPSLAEVHLEANNRTWDTITERGDELGVYTDARPPYGCLGLRLKR